MRAGVAASYLAVAVFGVAVGTSAALLVQKEAGGQAATSVGEMKTGNIELQDRDRVVMRDLRWECLYMTNARTFPDGDPPAPRGPVLFCQRLGSWGGGIQVATNLYYVVANRGTNTAPNVLLVERRP